jgi:hypothetical protein
LRATWADAGAAHVFRVVTAHDLAPLAYYSTADELVYAGCAIAAPPTRYLAVPDQGNAGASLEAVR